MKAALIVVAVSLLVVIATKTQFAGHSPEAVKAPRATTDAIPPVELPSSLGQSDEAGPEIKLVLLALLPHGFETNEMQLESGDYLLIIGNRTGLREVNVRLDREGKERVAAAAAGGRQREWKKRVKLTPGNYIVTANDNPEWTCRIVVRP
jgi:hypothetical protein